MISKADKELILQRLRDRGYSISRWCRVRGICPRHFYYVLAGERGNKHPRENTLRIWEHLKRDGIWPIPDGEAKLASNGD